MKRLSEIKVKKQNEVLTDEEMKRIVGGGGGTCYYKCECTLLSGPPIYVKDDCSSGGPWDRDTRCKTGLQICYYLSMY